MSNTYDDYLKVNSTPVPNQKVWDILQCSSFHITISANDLFSYATSYQVDICTIDLVWVLPVIEKYGISGLYASISYIEQLVVLPSEQNELYWSALKDIYSLNPCVYSDTSFNLTYEERKERMKNPKPWYPTKEQIGV